MTLGSPRFSDTDLLIVHSYLGLWRLEGRVFEEVLEIKSDIRDLAP